MHISLLLCYSGSPGKCEHQLFASFSHVRSAETFTCAERCCHALPWTQFRSLTVIMLMTSLSPQTRLKVCRSSWTNYMAAYTRFKGLKLNTDKTKVKVFFSSNTHAIPTFTYNGTPLELVTQFKYLGITLTRDGSVLSWEDGNFRPALARVYRTDGGKADYSCCGNSRSLLCQLVCTVVKYGPLLPWHMIPQKSPPHMSLILSYWKNSWVPRKVLTLTACSAKQVRCPFFLLVQLHHTFLEQFTLFKQSSSWVSCAGWTSSF